MPRFNLPIIDPNSLPAMRHQPPGLIPGPVRPPVLGPSPGFRPPPAMTMAPMAMPQAAPGFRVASPLNAIGNGLAKVWPKRAPDPTRPGVPTPQGDPTGGAGPAFLGGITSLGADPNALLMKIDPLTGLSWPNASWENFRG